MSRPSLGSEDVTRRNGIPVTCPARTLVDLATVLRPTALERAVNEADKYDLIDPEALRGALERFAGEQTRDRRRDQAHVATGLTTLVSLIGRSSTSKSTYAGSFVRRPSG